jgi:hypothetical protein
MRQRIEHGLSRCRLERDGLQLAHAAVLQAKSS